MRHWKLFTLGAVLVPGAAFAQDSRIAAAGTAEQDLQCAAWAAYIVGTNDDPDVKQGFGYAMTYFVGLYEGKSGKDFPGPMIATAQTLDNDPSLVEALNPVCIPRTKDIGQRLSDFGDTATDAGSQLEPVDGDKD